jgi:signal transduction histidine kinase
MFDSIFKKIIAIFVAILIFSFSITGIILYYTLGDFAVEEGVRELDYNLDNVNDTINYTIKYTEDNLYSSDQANEIINNAITRVANRTGSIVFMVDDSGNVINFKYESTLDIENIKVNLGSEEGTTYGNLSSEDQYIDLVNGKKSYLIDYSDFYGLFKGESVNAWLTVGKPVLIEEEGKLDEILGAIYISKPYPKVAEIRNEIIKFFIYSVLISTLIAVILFYTFSLKLTNPLKEMNKAVKVISKGDFRERLSIESNDEVGELARNFNNMVSALNELEEMRSGFIANVSHELRTPVTSIKGFVEGILDGTISKEKQNEYLLIVKEETIRLNRLVNNLLNLAKIESGSINISFTVFDINELVRRTIIRFENLIVEKDLNINANFDEEYVYVNADRDSIEQVLINLLHNAIKFTEKNGSINLKTEIQKNRVYITIEDTGIGIGKEELARIWDRFYKTDKSRSKDKKGAGLGLSIVKNIIKENKGKIWVESELNKGTKFTFILEKANNSSK